ncbi:MAG TPA: hypothetical protein PKN12_06565 [Bacteroidales bacterium]|nr:hypothetical protein [Bacteroidales bacterium]
MKIIHWFPRILCILAILFVSLFALDSFDPNLSATQQWLGFFMHLIPSFILIILLIIAWKWELIGGSILAIVGFGLTPYVFIGNYHHNHSFWLSLGIIASITLPFVITGGLFILSYYVKRKRGHQTPPSAQQ